MRGASAAKTSQRQAKDRQQEVLYDRELEGLPPELRWREWMLRVEAVIFASSEPVSREMLARSGRFANIYTELAPASTFWRAEEYHQDYFKQHPNQGYCAFVVVPKVDKFKKTFAQHLKPDA